MPHKSPESEDRRLNALAAEIKRRGLKPPAGTLAAAAAKAIALRGLIVHKTFRAFVAATKKGLLDSPHMVKLVDVMDRLVRGELQHGVIFAPPPDLQSE